MEQSAGPLAVGSAIGDVGLIHEPTRQLDTHLVRFLQLDGAREGDRLSALIRRTGGNRSRPIGDALRSRIFVDCLIGALRERRRIVDRGHDDVEVVRR